MNPLIAKLRPQSKPDPMAQFQEVEQQLQQAANNVELYEGALRDLEMQLMDQGWQRLSGGDTRDDFSDAGRRELVDLARFMSLKNPLIRRNVNLQAAYVFGQGVEIKARDPEVQDRWDAFARDRGNRDELTGHLAQVVNERTLQHDGELFFVWFSDFIRGTVRVRSFKPEQVTQTITNPEDAREVWFYKRVWFEERVNPTTGEQVSEQRIRYYASHALPEEPPSTSHLPKWPSTIGGIPVDPGARVYHVKVGHLKWMKRGVTDFYAAMDWATATKEYLEDAASIWRSLARFAWRLRGKTRKGLNAVKSKVGTTRGVGEVETNPPPTAGAVAALTEGNQLEPMPKSGATMDPDDHRALRLMVAAATDTPDSVLANDPQQGALATAQTLDRPSELGYRNRQMVWERIFKDTADHVIMVSVEARRIPGAKIESDEYGTQMVLLPKGKDKDGKTIERDAQVDVVFPPILEHDVTDSVGAIVSAAPHLPKDLVAEQLMGALGVQDTDRWEEWLEGLKDDPNPDPPPPPPGAEPDEPPEPDEPNESMKAAARAIAQMIRENG